MEEISSRLCIVTTERRHHGSLWCARDPQAALFRATMREFFYLRDLHFPGL